MQKKPIFWIAIFFIFLILTQITSFIDFGMNTSVLGLPNWLFYFSAVHVLFVVLLFYFDQYLFKEKEV